MPGLSKRARTCAGLAAAVMLAFSAGAGASEAEPMLLSALHEIQASRIDSAEKKVDELLRRYPNFRLAHLIKGDLLLAHAQPLASIGGGARAAPDKLADLRAEAVVRARRAVDPPPPGLVPQMIWQLADNERNVVVVDTSNSRLFLFENIDGMLSPVADYYVSIGRLGAGKTREGDQKTPVGVYRTIGSIAPARLSDFYGSAAFPLNYPNEWDRRQGHSGHGIWLHGTPSDTYSRPPFASDGCVVLANGELQSLARRIYDGPVPVVIAPRIDWVAPETLRAQKGELMAEIETWRKDWESRDVARYLKHYGANFQAQGKDIHAWRAHKQNVNAQRSFIRVGVENLSVMQYPGQDSLAVVSFDQDYRSDGLSNQMRKEQYWQRANGRWQIVYEGPGAAPATAVALNRSGLIKVAAKGSRKSHLKTRRS
jgi:murein L,D-transpeptidase YafK